MSIVHKIRQQPHHVRELATLVCTIAVVAVVVAVWFNSFQHDLYATLNPEQQPAAQDQLFAQQSKSLFSSIVQTLNDSKAQISSIFSGKSQTDVINNSTTNYPDYSGATHPLPVSGDR